MNLVVLVVWSFLSLFLFNSSSYAISIDNFAEFQSTVVGGAGNSGESGLETTGAIGGSRTITAEVTASGSPFLGVNAVAVMGIYSHSQDTTVSGSSKVIWDGSADPTSLDPTGLQGIDLTDDESDRFIVDVVAFDWASSNPAHIDITVYDASDASGGTYSRGRITLNAQILSSTLFELPFTELTDNGPNGGADLTNVGAITLGIDGASPTVDLALGPIRTNGVCPQTPDVGEDVRDECGVCGGDNSSCLDCDGIPNSGKEIDECGVCGGDGTSCRDCEGTLNGPKIIDQCGVCDGDGKTCLNCSDVDITLTQFELDQGVKSQEQHIIRVLRKLRRFSKSKATERFIKRLKEEAHELQVKAWVLSWQLPSIVSECENIGVCVTVDNNIILNEYRGHSEQLYRIALRSIKRVAKFKSGKALKKFKRKERRKARRIFTTNMSLSETVPETHVECI